eukprot:2570028-Rhodomonas_salina.1
MRRNEGHVRRNRAQCSSQPSLRSRAGAFPPSAISSSSDVFTIPQSASTGNKAQGASSALSSWTLDWVLSGELVRQGSREVPSVCGRRGRECGNGVRVRAI